jgi:ABC-type antimicrobial peptide transport system permease subunit
LILILEFGIHRLEKFLKNHFYKEIMHKLTRELMLLGLISFCVGLLESTGFFELIFSAYRENPNIIETSHQITLRRVMIFEVVHIAIFVLSIFYVLVCLLSFWITEWLE